MTNAARWHHNNEAYLTAALTWLRLRLAAVSGQPSAVSGHMADNRQQTKDDEPQGGWVSKKRKPATPLPALRMPCEPPQPKSESVSEAEVAQAAAEMQAAEQ